MSSLSEAGSSVRRLLWRWRPPSVGVETDVALGESVRSISIVGFFVSCGCFYEVLQNGE